MTLKEMFDRVLIQSGQLLLTPEELEVQPGAFLTLVKATLPILNDYMPWDRRETIPIGGTHHQFTVEIPEWLCEVTPIQILGMPWQIYMESFDFEYTKKSFVWRYLKPDLYLQAGGIFDVHKVFYHQLTKVYGTQDEWEIVTITDDFHEFFEMLTGKFMQLLGRIRRSFTLDDFPVKVDAAQMITEGKAMEEDGFTDLVDRGSAWRLAMK